MRPADEREPPRAAQASAPVEYPVLWSASLGLASLHDLRSRISQPSADTTEWVQFDMRCDPVARPGQRRCVDVDTVVVTTCADFSRRVASGYAVRANINFVTMRDVGARCAALQALAGARPPMASAVRRFRLNRAALDSLPPVLGVLVNSDDSARAWVAAQRGESWARASPELRASVGHSPEGDDELRVDGPDEWARIVVLARGDFDGDGWDDLLVRSDEGVKGGTMASTVLFLLTRKTPDGPLRVVRQLW